MSFRTFGATCGMDYSVSFFLPFLILQSSIMQFVKIATDVTATAILIGIVQPTIVTISNKAHKINNQVFFIKLLIFSFYCDILYMPPFWGRGLRPSLVCPLLLEGFNQCRYCYCCLACYCSKCGYDFKRSGLFFLFWFFSHCSHLLDYIIPHNERFVNRFCKNFLKNFNIFSVVLKMI